jgi:hypothetical protein
VIVLPGLRFTNSAKTESLRDWRLKVRLFMQTRRKRCAILISSPVRRHNAPVTESYSCSRLQRKEGANDFSGPAEASR